MTTIPYKLITNCRGCLGHDFEHVLAFPPGPLAGEFSLTHQSSVDAPTLPLTWICCTNCGLTQVYEDVADDILYTKYNYSSSSIKSLIAHFKNYADSLVRTYHERISILEIGCNDGILLRQLPTSWRRVGVDPSDVAKLAASSSTYELLSEPFSAKLIGTLGIGTFDIITGSNCLAHFSNLAEAFAVARLLLRDSGHFIVEVHDLEETLRLGQWDTIYHEHKVEWSIESLQRCVTPAGFALHSYERLPLHGGVIRATFEAVTTSNNVIHEHRFDPRLHDLAQKHHNRRSTSNYERIALAPQLVAYGASGRGNVWMNHHPELGFKYVIDDSSLRCGKYIPTRGVPIISSGNFQIDPTTLCVVTAWNYYNDIVAKHPQLAGQFAPSIPF